VSGGQRKTTWHAIETLFNAVNFFLPHLMAPKSFEVLVLGIPFALVARNDLQIPLTESGD